jgi:hypothetical protein
MSASNNPIIAQQTADRKENQQTDKRPVAHSSLFVGGPREENATIQTPVAVLTGDVRRGEKFLDLAPVCYDVPPSVVGPICSADGRNWSDHCSVFDGKK